MSKCALCGKEGDHWLYQSINDTWIPVCDKCVDEANREAVNEYRRRTDSE